MVSLPISVIVVLVPCVFNVCVCTGDVQNGKKLKRREKLSNEMSTLFADDVKLAERARELYKNQYYTDALEYFTKAIGKNSSIAEYFVERGECYLKMQDETAAVEDFRQAIRLAADPMPYRILLCKTLLDFGKVDEAKKEVVFLDEVELLKMGEVLCSQSKLEEAIVCYNAAIAKSPHEMYYRTRGLCFERMRHLDMAILDFKTAVALPQEYKDDQTQNLLIQMLLDVKDYDGLMKEIRSLDYLELERRGDTLRSQSKFNEAICFYTEAITKHPHERYYRSRGLCYMDLRNLNQALQDFKTATMVQADYADNQTRTLLIEMLLETRNMDEAAKEMPFLDADELVKLGDKYRFQNKFDEALSFYTAAITKHPDKKSYRSRGICFMDMKKPELAISDFQTAISMPAEYPDNLTPQLLIKAILESGNFETAMLAMESLESAELLHLGDSLCHQHKFQEALCFYAVAIKKQPSSAKYFYSRANCYVKMGAVNEAHADFQKVVEADQQLSEAEKYDRSRILLIAALFEQGNPDAAHREMRPLNSAQIRALGDELYERRIFDRADGCYSVAVNKDRKNPENYEKRAEYNLKRGSWRSAISDYQDALAIDSTRVDSWVALLQLWIKADEYREAKTVLDRLDRYFSNMTPENAEKIKTARSQIDEYEQGKARERKRQEDEEAYYQQQAGEADRKRREEQERAQRGINRIIWIAGTG